MNQRKLQRGDILGLVLVFIVAICMLSLPFLPVPQRSHNWGFDQNWSCTNVAIDPLCIRRPSVPSH
jgi:hypothetical protein